MAGSDKKSVDFEAALEELEQLVTRMESGELPLEDALKQFERGITLTRDCQRALREAEQKVDMLMDKAGESDTAPFEPDQ
jgi:exodeoxyribonuclease VII small subunit